MKKNNVNPNMVGVAVGGVLGLWHLGWSTLVAIGWAQAMVDTVAQLHMIQPPILVSAFSVDHAIGLVLVASGGGYIVGYLSGMIWNAAHNA